MTTDNRTNEPSQQVMAAAMEMAIIDLPSMHSLEDRVLAREKWRRYQWEAERVLGEVAKVTPKPSVEAIANVEAERRYVMAAPGPHECSCGEVMPECSTSWLNAHRIHRADCVLALVAAQGAAPQAEGVPKSTYISPNLPGMIRNLWKSDPSENSVRTALKLAGDLIQELIDIRAAPVEVDREAMQ